MLENFVIGLTSGFVASFACIYFLFRFLRPKIEISGFISKETVDSKPEYGFKFINRTKYPIIDVKYLLELVRSESVHGGSISIVKKLKEGSLFQIEQFSSKDNDAQYAHRLSYKEPLETQWTDDAKLRLRVIAKHALSGHSCVFTKIYHIKRTAIKSGAHNWGTSLDVA